MLDVNSVMIEKQKSNQEFMTASSHWSSALLSSEWSLSWRWSRWHQTRHFNGIWDSTSAGIVLGKAFFSFLTLSSFSSQLCLATAVKQR